MSRDFSSIDQYPDQVDAVGVLLRLLDGLGFRFYWATHGLKEKDYSYAPSEGSNSLGWVVGHVRDLMNWIQGHLRGERATRPTAVAAQREQALELMGAIREHLAGLSADRLAEVRIEGLPFWNMINGPLSDALTHVGQINTLRRLLGKPAPRAHVFTGKPPTDW